MKKLIVSVFLLTLVIVSGCAIEHGGSGGHGGSSGHQGHHH